jgi:hypothetical protein
MRMSLPRNPANHSSKLEAYLAAQNGLTISDLHRDVISSEALQTSTDLHEVVRAVLARYAAEGGQAENNGAYGFVFMGRGWLDLNK